MWYPVSDVVENEPVSVDDARFQIFSDEDDFDATLGMLIGSARAHVERYCNRQFAVHGMVWACDSWGDLSRLPAAPLVGDVEITYTDADGAVQSLDADIYQVRKDGLDPHIALAAGAAWPVIAPSSRITLTAKFGGGTPDDVKHAMLLLIADGFTARENAVRPSWTTVDALLSNHRRGAW